MFELKTMHIFSINFKIDNDDCSFSILVFPSTASDGAAILGWFQNTGQKMN